MWPKPSRKKGKSQGTKSRLKALKEDKSEKAEDSGKETRSEKRKTRPPNRNRKKAGELEKRKDRKKQDTKARLKSQAKPSKSKQEAVEKKAEPQEVDNSQSPSVKQHESDQSNVWKDKILTAYKGSPRDSGRLMASVPNKKAQFEAGERQKQELIEESMIKVVDKMFDNFQNTAYGFNQVTQGSDLELVWIRPSLVTESAGSWVEGQEGLKVFSGRISTRYWTLVIRGSVNSIVSFILPADKLLSFGSSVFDFDPYAELVPQSDGMSVNWLIQDNLINQDLFPSVFRALLDGLIRYANEEAEPNETFRLEDIGLQSEAKQETMEIPTPREEDGPELLSMEEEQKAEKRAGRRVKKTMLNEQVPEEIRQQVANEQQPQSPEPEIAPENMVKKQTARTQEMDRKPAQKPHVELAIDEAFEIASQKASEERVRQQQDIVDPGAGFIQNVSSQLANQATQEIDQLREAITNEGASSSGAYSQPQVSDEQAIEQTGQWKLVGSNLPPAVASQWQNYVSKTGDEVGAGAAEHQQQAQPAQNVPEEPQWNSVDAEFPPDASVQAPVQSQDSGAWVHPSQQMPGQNAQYSQPVSQPVSPPVSQPPQQPAMQDAGYDPEETVEFNSDSGHSHYLLTEDDIDDRAIQTPPPDPNVGPQANEQQEDWTEQQVEEEVVEEETVFEEEGIEYEIEETEEEYEYEEHTYEMPQASGNLVGALSNVVATIDHKVEILSQKGAEAFSDKDFKRAEVIIKLSERLNDFKEEANLLLSILGQEED